MNRATRSRSVANESGYDLQRDVTIQPGVARAKHLAHAAFTDGRTDFVDAETSAGNEGQSGSDYTWLRMRFPLTLVRCGTNGGTRRDRLPSHFRRWPYRTRLLSGSSAWTSCAVSRCSGCSSSISTCSRPSRAGSTTWCARSSGGWWKRSRTGPLRCSSAQGSPSSSDGPKRRAGRLPASISAGSPSSRSSASRRTPSSATTCFSGTPSGRCRWSSSASGRLARYWRRRSSRPRPSCCIR